MAETGYRQLRTSRANDVMGTIARTFSYIGKHYRFRYDGKVYRELMAAALNAEKRRGVAHIVFFDDDTTHADTLACGFRCVGQYVCFRKTIEADGGAL